MSRIATGGLRVAPGRVRCHRSGDWRGRSPARRRRSRSLAGHNGSTEPRSAAERSCCCCVRASSGRPWMMTVSIGTVIRACRPIIQSVEYAARIAAVSSPFGKSNVCQKSGCAPAASTPIAWSSPRKKRAHNFEPRGASVKSAGAVKRRGGRLDQPDACPQPAYHLNRRFNHRAGEAATQANDRLSRSSLISSTIRSSARMLVACTPRGRSSGGYAGGWRR